MELQFAPKTMHYLQCVHYQCGTQEETLELIVPDSFPDAEKTLCSSALVVLRGKECSQTGASANGGVRANVLYMAAEETQPRSLEAYLPFTIKVDVQKLCDDGDVNFAVNVRSVDVRMLNSRKLLLRVNLCWTMSVYGPCKQELYSLDEAPADLQTKTTEYSMMLPAETAECTFQMAEELSLPSNRPLVGSVLRFQPRLEITERRLAGNKAVFKGVAHLHVLYVTEADEIAAYDTEWPFSQYCELHDIYEEEDVQIHACLAGCECDRTMQQDADGLLVTLHILAQCVVMRRENVCITDDAYSLSGKLVPQWTECTIENCLDQQRMTRMVRENKNANVQEIVDAWAYSDLGKVTKTNDGVEVTLPSTVNLLYRDDAGKLQSMSFRTELKESIAAAENVKCRAYAEVAGEVVAIPSGNSIDLRYPIAVTIESFSDGTYRTLSGGEILEQKENAERPAVILRKTSGGEPLWDIAKKNGTTVEKIRSANRVNDDFTEAGVILIPV